MLGVTPRPGSHVFQAWGLRGPGWAGFPSELAWAQNHRKTNEKSQTWCPTPTGLALVASHAPHHGKDQDDVWTAILLCFARVSNRVPRSLAPFGPFWVTWRPNPTNGYISTVRIVIPRVFFLIQLPGPLNGANTLAHPFFFWL